MRSLGKTILSMAVPTMSSWRIQKVSVVANTSNSKMGLKGLFAGQQRRNRQKIDLQSWGEGRRG